MTRNEWTTRFAARLVEAGGKTEDEAAITAADFIGGEEAYGDPEVCADNLIEVWDDHFEGSAA